MGKSEVTGGSNTISSSAFSHQGSRLVGAGVGQVLVSVKWCQGLVQSLLRETRRGRSKTGSKSCLGESKNYENQKTFICCQYQVMALKPKMRKSFKIFKCFCFSWFKQVDKAAKPASKAGVEQEHSGQWCTQGQCGSKLLGSSRFEGQVWPGHIVATQVPYRSRQVQPTCPAPTSASRRERSPHLPISRQVQVTTKGTEMSSGLVWLGSNGTDTASLSHNTLTGWWTRAQKSFCMKNALALDSLLLLVPGHLCEVQKGFLALFISAGPGSPHWGSQENTTVPTTQQGLKAARPK